MKSPHEKWHRHEVANFGESIKHLRVLGCTAYVFIPKVRRKRGDERCVKGVFMGYVEENKAYKILVDNEIVVARSGYFNETEFPMRMSENEKSGREIAKENLMTNKHRAVDDIILEEFAGLRDDDVTEMDGRHVIGQGSDDESDSDEEVERIGTQYKSRKEVGEGLSESEFNEYEMDGDDNDEDDVNEPEIRRNEEVRDRTGVDDDEEKHMGGDEEKKGPEQGEMKQPEHIPLRRSKRERMPTGKLIRQAQGILGLAGMVNRGKATRRERREWKVERESDEMRMRNDMNDDAIERHGERMVCNEFNGNRDHFLSEGMEGRAVGLVTRIHGADVPRTRKLMLEHPNKDLFIEGEKKELESLERMQAWKLVPLPPGKRCMKSGWVYDVKTGLGGETIYKSRFVAKGYSQVYGTEYMEVFSPTMQLKTFRILLAIHSGNKRMVMECWDVSSAFLYAPMEEELYINQPAGYERGTDVLKLLKSLYGTKQASRNWSKSVKGAMLKVGFVQSENDPCLYRLDRQGSFIHAVIHVDDFAVFHDNQKLCDEIFEELTKSFTLKRGKLTHFLGMRVERREDGTITLDQEEYAKSIIQRFDMDGCKPVVCPEMPVKLSKSQSPQNPQEELEMKDIPYSPAVGCLQYLVVCTRVDMTHAVSQVSRFMQSPGKIHCNAVLRIMRYLKGTLGQRLVFSKGPAKAVLTAFSDADHAGCPDTRRSHSGYAVKVNGTAVAWISRRQRCVALSSCESEYIAICECAKQVVWVRRLLSELGHGQKDPTPIYCDNQAAKALTENPVHHDRTKHVDMQYHYTRDLIENNVVVVSYIPATEEQADILTKEYVGKNFVRLRDSLMSIMKWVRGIRKKTLI